jgi:hypothetical protein
MKTRLFHAIVVCGASLGVLPLGCGEEPSIELHDGGVPPDGTDRCQLPAGGCDEHCTPLADGACLDPCFVHTETCSPDCVQFDGSCGWPPTK